MDLVFLLSVVGEFLNQQAQFHTEGHSSALVKLIVAFLVFLLFDFIASALAIAMERDDADRWKNIRLLGHFWLQRFTYRQLFSLVILITLKRMLQGNAFKWGKLERTAAMRYPLEQDVVARGSYVEGDADRAA
jgi:hypothetical protein